MAEQPTDKTETQAAPAADSAAAKDTPKPAETTAAMTALAEAVAGARKPEPETVPKKVELKGAAPSKAQAAPSPSAPAPAPLAPPAAEKPAPVKAVEPADAGRRYPMRAAGLALAIGLGVAGGAYALSRPVDEGAETALRQWTESAGASLRQNQEDVTRLSGDVRALKAAVDGLKDGLDRSKGDAARSGVIVERLDRTDRATAEIGVKLAKLSEQLDRVERGEKEGVAKVSLLQEAKATQLNERFERLERHVQAAANSIAAIQTAPKPTPPPAPLPEPAQTASITPPKPDPKTVPVDGFVVRDVYDGMALIEGRNKRLHEVSPGSNLPGVGRVESIERRGKTWVVMTAKGVIPMERW